MTKPRLLLLTVGLLVILSASACAPAASSPTYPAPSASSPATSTLAPTQQELGVEPGQTAEPEFVPTQAPTEIPTLAVATSRGPNLEATDPTSVSLASGQIQLVEFFRFT